MKKLILVISVLLPWYFFLNPAPAHAAETQQIFAEGTYIMGDGETPIIAEGRAVEQAKRFAVEQAGTYVKSYSRVKNFEIAEDEIEVIASGMLEISILDKKRMLEADAVKFWVRITAIVRSDNIKVIAERVREQGLGEDYEKMKTAYNQSQTELAKLKEQLAAAKAEPERKEIIGRLSVQEKGFRSRQLYSDALSAFSAGRMDEALELIARCVADNPAFYQAFMLRGFLHFRQGKYDKAIPDFDRVIALTPGSAKAYAGRGMCYSNKNRFKVAITDLTQALQLNPGFPRVLEDGIHGHLGRSLLAEGDLPGAKHHLLIACKISDQKYCRALQSPRLKNLKQKN